MKKTIEKNKIKYYLFRTVKFQIMASLMVPMIFIILLGIVTFKKASDVVEEKYEQTCQNLMNMAGKCMEVGFNSVEASAILFADDSEIQRYSISQDDKIQAFVYKDSLGNVLCSKKEKDELIRNIYLINKNVESISTGDGIDDEIYDHFKKTDLGKLLDSKTVENLWDGEDTYLDQQLKTNAADYSMRLLKNVGNFDAFLIIDVQADFVRNILTDLHLEEASFIGLITQDGKEVSLKEEKITGNQDFYRMAMDGEEVSGLKYVKYQGENCLFLYSKVGDTQAVIYALIPQSTIMDQANPIKHDIIILVVIACIIMILAEKVIVTCYQKSK